MSKPKYGWWGYAKWIIRQYPAREGKFIQGKALEEQTAVKRAIDQTKQMENGMERIQVIEMVFLLRLYFFFRPADVRDWEGVRLSERR